MRTFLVGGAVRDELMGVPNNDRDFVVVGTTEQALLDAGFKNVGEAFPVFLHPETGDEYAMARREKKTGKGYTGFSVEFGADVTLAEDLSRRDLTINAMAKDLVTGEIEDPYGGREDLKNKVLRHVSSAFSEDPLRVVRLARFFARFTDFTIAEDTLTEARRVVDTGEMDALSNERFWQEMRKTFEQSTNPERFFDALFMFGALNKVKFFKDVFGTVDYTDVGFSFPAIMEQVLNMEVDDRLDLFVSLVASRDAKQEGQAFPVRIQKLTSNLKTLRSMGDATPEALFQFIQQNRGWEKIPSKAMRDVVAATFVGEKAGWKFPAPSSLIAVASDRGSQVSAEDFLHLPGKEIGQRLAETRLAAVRHVMRDWT